MAKHANETTGLHGLLHPDVQTDLGRGLPSTFPTPCARQEGQFMRSWCGQERSNSRPTCTEAYALAAKLRAGVEYGLHAF